MTQRAPDTPTDDAARAASGDVVAGGGPPCGGGMTPAARWTVYTLLIAAALGQAMGKILAVNSVDLVRIEQRRVDDAVAKERKRLEADGLSGRLLEAAVATQRERLEKELRLQRPFLSGNDRSRWMAIRAIAERGEPHIDAFLEEPTWDSIDMVQHRGRDGELHQYSSKPPLLMVLLAAPYWLVIQLTGLTLADEPHVVGRALLLLFNGGALATLLVCVARLVERLGSGDVDRLAAFAVAAFGTQLSAFAPALSNHLFAAASTAIAVDAWTAMLRSGRVGVGGCVVAGLAAGIATACDLPALALAMLIGVSLTWRSPSAALGGFWTGLALVAAAFFGANYWTHDSLRPPYAHRSETDPEDNWYDYEYTAKGRTRDSYWRNRQGIDRGEESRAVYALHTLVGHHGVLSLTPVWLLSLAGGAAWLRSPDAARREAAWVALFVTAACLVFYIGLRPQGDRNYGGSTTGFRWLFWLAPLWVALIPAAAVRLTKTRLLAAATAAALAVSALSASYATWNPWTHPWLYVWMRGLGFEVL